jgi:hypothetical protein
LTFGVIGRYAARKYLHGKRSAGRAMRSVLAVGDAEAIGSFTAMLRRIVRRNVCCGCVRPGRDE